MKTFVSLLSLQSQNVSEHIHRRLFLNEHSALDHRLPDSLDWRDKGVVGPVRDQGDCNSCWAFAAAGSMDYWLKKELPSAEVNVKDVLSCSPNCYGCAGGLMDNAFKYTGLFSLGYAYTGKVGKCSRRTKGLRATGLKVVSMDAEKYLAHMLFAYGPVAVAVDFSKQHRYTGRKIIRAEECTSDPSHAVLLVGYTQTYWILKNSKGISWGDNGYAYVERNRNACGINTYASVSTGIEMV